MSDTLKHLEQQADHHRVHAHSALSTLLSALAPAKLGKDAVGAASGSAEDLAHTALQHARANPAGLALIGVGAAMIALKRPRMNETSVHGTEADRIARADAKLQEKASVSANATPPTASSMRKALDAGLDHLPPKARDRVIEVRLKAIDAQEAVERNARKLAAQARDAHQTQPFVTALAVAGIGALAGALLPSTRTEDALLGAKRDQLMRSAEATLKAEIAELEQRGKAAVDAAAREGQKAFDANQASA